MREVLIDNGSMHERMGDKRCSRAYYIVFNVGGRGQDGLFIKILTSEVQAFEVIAKKFLTETGSSPFSTGKGFKKLHRMFESNIALQPGKDFYLVIEHSLVEQQKWSVVIVDNEQSFFGTKREIEK